MLAPHENNVEHQTLFILLSLYNVHVPPGGDINVQSSMKTPPIANDCQTLTRQKQQHEQTEYKFRIDINIDFEFLK